MKLLTKELEKRFAKVGRQEKIKDPLVIVKFFNPMGRGYWFATEMWYNITNAVNSNSQMSGLQQSSQCKENQKMQDLFKQIDSKNKKKRQFVSGGKKKSSIQKWDKDGQRICDDIQSKPSISSQKLCKESNVSTGKETGKIFEKERGITSQKFNKGRRQNKKFGINEQDTTQILSHEDAEFETMEVNASELKKYPHSKINSIYFFGYVSLFGDYCDEWGYFGLEELENIQLPFRLHIERDRGFRETKMSEIIKKYTKV